MTLLSMISDNIHQKIRPFQLKEKYGGGNLKNESKDGFSGGASAGVPAQAAGLSFSRSARNRFEFHRTREPNSEQRAARAATDGRHAVPSIGFSGGKTAI